MSCCKPPAFVVTSVTTSATFVTLTVNRLFASVGDNVDIRICLLSGSIPANNTEQIQFTDGTDTFVARMWNGNFLRADSLRNFLNRRSCCRPCVSVTLCAFKGNDDAHITVFNRMCPSTFIPVATAT